MSHDDQIKQIRQKLYLLIKKYQIILQENATLKEQNKELKEKENALQSEISSLSHKNTVANFQLSELDTEEKIAIKKKLDFYLKEIDMCIATIKIK